MINMRDIETRWNNRVVPNRWDKQGRRGGEAYLQKYGKNIGDEKLQALAEFAKRKGCPEFADVMLESKSNYRRPASAPVKPVPISPIPVEPEKPVVQLSVDNGGRKYLDYKVNINEKEMEEFLQKLKVKHG